MLIFPGVHGAVEILPGAWGFGRRFFGSNRQVAAGFPRRLPGRPLLFLPFGRLGKGHAHLARSFVQRRQHPVVDTVKYFPLVEEFHLGLGRVDVDIHRRHRQLDTQHAGRKPPHHDLVAVSLFQRGRHHSGLDIAPVDKKDLAASVAPGGCGAGAVARKAHLFPLAVHGNHVQRRLSAQHRIDGGQKRPVSRGMQQFFPVPEKPHRHLRMRHRLLLHGGKGGGGLCGIGFHKLHTGGRVVKQAANNHGCAHGAAHRLPLQNLSRLQMEAHARVRLCRAGHDVNFGYRCRGRQRFAPEAQRVNGLQIFLAADLAGGMAQKGRLGVLRLHAAAVVGNADKGHAAVLYLHRHVFRTGVNGVLHQLLDNGGRPLHHLAGGDQIGHMGRKLYDFCHGFFLFSKR